MEYPGDLQDDVQVIFLLELLPPVVEYVITFSPFYFLLMVDLVEFALFRESALVP